MGWSSWNAFRCDISEDLIKEVADAIVASGLRDAGYRYINIDDCWMSGRDPSGAIVPSREKFPSGMRALGDYLHSRGLLFGIYSSAGDSTCEGLPGSYGYEEADARLYAEWGVDYLKYDFCGMEKRPEGPKEVYSRMRDALAAATRASGRPILYSLCNWGGGAPHRWGAAVGNSWRTGRDLFAVWDRRGASQLGLPGYLQSVMEAVDGQRLLARHAGPGGYNDPDMLVVGLEGMFPYGIVQACPPAVPDCTPGEYISRERWGMVGGLTAEEQRAHFGLWAVMAAPLLLGNDPRHMAPETVELLTAPEVIAVNQDPLGAQASVTSTAAAPATGEKTEVWSKPLAQQGAYALLLLNRGGERAEIAVSWARDCPEEGPGAADLCGRQIFFTLFAPTTTLPYCPADKQAPVPRMYAGGRLRSSPVGDSSGRGGCSTAEEPDGCEAWASSGECEKNPAYMLQSCGCSCQQVGVGADGGGGAESSSVREGPTLVRDLWDRRDLPGPFENGLALDVAPHSVRLLRVHFRDAAGAGLDADPSLQTTSEAPTEWMEGLGPRRDTGRGAANAIIQRGGAAAGCGPWGTMLAVENLVLLAAALLLYRWVRVRRSGVHMVGSKRDSLKL